MLGNTSRTAHEALNVAIAAFPNIEGKRVIGQNGGQRRWLVNWRNGDLEKPIGALPSYGYSAQIWAPIMSPICNATMTTWHEKHAQTERTTGIQVQFPMRCDEP